MKKNFILLFITIIGSCLTFANSSPVTDPTSGSLSSPTVGTLSDLELAVQITAELTVKISELVDILEVLEITSSVDIDVVVTLSSDLLFQINSLCNALGRIFGILENLGVDIEPLLGLFLSVVKSVSDAIDALIEVTQDPEGLAALIIHIKQLTSLEEGSIIDLVFDLVNGGVAVVLGVLDTAVNIATDLAGTITGIIPGGLLDGVTNGLLGNLLK